MVSGSYMSFLVRLWPAQAADGSTHCAAEVEHIQSGRCWNFASANEAWKFLCAATVDPARLEAPSTPPHSVDRNSRFD